MTVNHGPFRVDHVGSFFRPKELVEAREAFAEGTISQEELTAVEDQAIRALVSKEIKAGLKNVTDGEFRRAYWSKLLKAIIFMGRQPRRIQPSLLVRLPVFTILL